VRKPGALASLSNAPGQSSSDTELREQNKVLQDRYEAMQKQFHEMMKERTSLADELSELKMSFDTMKNRMGAEMQGASAVKEMEQQLANTRSLLDNKSSEVEKIREDMNKRLGDSNQFKELKGIVAKKNTQIKSLRDRLAKYETPDDGTGLLIQEGA